MKILSYEDTHLVPEEEVSLAEFKLFNIECLGKGNADNVKGCKKPATTGAFLICNRLDLCINFVLEDMLCSLLKATPGSAHFHWICTSAGILPKQILVINEELFAQSVQFIKTQA